MDIEYDPIEIDIIIPSIRMNAEKLLSMLDMSVPQGTKLCYYIISDNPSMQSADLTHKGHPVHVIANEKNLGAPLSRNVGLDAGKGQYVFFIDDDVVPDPNILYEYASAIKEHPDAAGYIGPTRFPDPVGPFTRGIVASDMLSFFHNPAIREWSTWGTTSNIMLSRKKINSVRFSSMFPKHGGGEDIDFCLRIMSHSKRWFKTVPRAQVKHNWWNGGRRSYARFFRWAFGDSSLPSLHQKYRFYNFPNLTETMILGMPVLACLSLGGLLPLAVIPAWAGLAMLCETACEYARIRAEGHENSPRIALESALIKSSNDLGRIAGPPSRKKFPAFFARFDYFGTRESVPFERKVAAGKFASFVLSIAVSCCIFAASMRVFI